MDASKTGKKRAALPAAGVGDEQPKEKLVL
jgi:hypothetical protein